MNINATLLGQSIAFVMFVLLCMKYIWPPIIGALTQRQQKIADGLAAADQGVRDLEQARSKATDILREAREQAAEIIEQAHKRGDQVVDAAKERANEEGTRILHAARVSAEGEFQRAKAALQADMGDLIITGTRQVLGKVVNDSVQDGLLDQLVAEL